MSRLKGGNFNALGFIDLILKSLQFIKHWYYKLFFNNNSSNIPDAKIIPCMFNFFHSRHFVNFKTMYWLPPSQSKLYKMTHDKCFICTVSNAFHFIFEQNRNDCDINKQTILLTIYQSYLSFDEWFKTNQIRNHKGSLLKSSIEDTYSDIEFFL